MSSINKKALPLMIIACLLFCTAVSVPAFFISPTVDSVDGATFAVQSDENGQESADDGCDLVVIEDDEIPMAEGGGANLTSAQRTEIANKVVKLVNISRKQASKGTLKKGSKLKKSSKTRAKELEKSFSHTRPNGKSWTTAFKKAGVKVSKVYCGENLAMKITTARESYSAEDIEALAQSFHANLMNSPSHKKNIVSGNYKKIGITVHSSVGSDGRLHIYLCQHFCSK